MKSIQAVTEIAAPVETVWAELTAVASYAEWNPFITKFDGELSVGARPEVQIAPPGARPMSFRPTITEVSQGERLEWIGRVLMPGIFDGRHSFRLEAIGDDRTRLTQTEQFSGLLVAVTGGMLAKTQAGFEAMNEALRERAEKVTGRTPEALQQ
ncbi:MAG: hypothetical protein JWR85_3346 [Marmoricola sp.]|nr:hypothetical protein [Marmoricola sp.]